MQISVRQVVCSALPVTIAQKTRVEDTTFSANQALTGTEMALAKNVQRANTVHWQSRVTEQMVLNV